MRQTPASAPCGGGGKGCLSDNRHACARLPDRPAASAPWCRLEQGTSAPPLPAYTSNTQTNVWVLYGLDYSPVEPFYLSTHVRLLPAPCSRLVGAFSSLLAASADQTLTVSDQDRFNQVAIGWHRHTLGLAALLQILQGDFDLVVVHRVVQKF